MLPRVRAEPEVAQATPIQLVTGAIPGQPGAIVLGLEPGGFAAHQLVIVAGNGLAHGQVLVGDTLARRLHLRPGSRLKFSRQTMPVGGIFHSGLSYEDSGAVLDLRDAQALAGRTPAEVTTFAVKLRPQVAAAAGVRELKRALPGVTAIADPSEAVRAGVNTALISKAVLFMVVLALIIGGLTVANAMQAALLERRRELALLATIGWSAPQLGALVLGESLAVSMLGTGGGLLLGLAAAKLLPGALGLGDFITPALTAWGLGRAVLIGLAIGTLGAIYPIWRVMRIRSAVALALT
jgi:putative ABC transport system permease protein